MRILIAVALFGGLGGPVFGQACPKPPGWDKPERHLAARAPEMKFALKPGGTAQIGLLAQDQVKFASGPVTRKGYAGLAAIDVVKGGTLQLVLDNKTYVDLVRGGKALPLAAEPHGHGCPGIQKMLAFKVQPGRYLVELSGSPAKSIKFAATLR